MKSAVFLDRDGVINGYFCDPEFGTIDSPGTPDEFSLLEGVYDGLACLREAGLLLIVISNQPGIAKARFTRALLDATTQKMIEECAGQLDAVYYCLHHPDAVVPEYRMECDCRKPKPGLLFQAAREWDIDLSESYMVGDGIVDIQAGKAAGCSTIFIGSRKCYVCKELEERRTMPDFFAPNLKGAAEIVCAKLANKPIASQFRSCS